GFHGSGPGHWQTWMESQVRGARRVVGIDWEAPVLGAWVAAVRRQILRSPGRVWLVAHSFGCLVAVAAGVGLGGRVAGAMLVAPANPERFSRQGLRQAGRPGAAGTLSAVLRRQRPGFPSLVVASSNDPWMPVRSLTGWTATWGSQLIGIGQAGHINAESGFGPWPGGLALLEAFQSAVPPRPARHAAC
uniref:RBBP9/YdeN family alpha/beta hydrolase n=1 Tax=uncultured Thiodictyon sp. TaxID=1846217 RepID=UPI0025CD6CA7